MKHARRGRSRRRALSLFVAIAVIVTVDVAVVVVRSAATDQATASPTTTAPTTTTTSTTTTVPQPQIPVLTTLATPRGVIATFDAPDGGRVGEAGRWYGRPMTMPVVEERGPWVRIELPERPNQSTAWVHTADVDLSSTPYRLVIRRSQTNLTAYQAGVPLFTLPAGIGADRTPTPLGTYFVAVIEKPGPSPGYGPIVLDLSAHSEAIRSWQGSGDAIIAVHGPISSASDAQIGTTGTRISNGCIRLHKDDQLRLDVIPLGTPVDIVD